MLQYRDELNYSISNGYNIDEQLQQLNYLCKKNIKDYQLYKQIRSYIYKEIKIEQLAVTTILKDLSEIRKKSPKTALLLEFFIANNELSYSQIASYFNCSKQNIYQILTKLARNYKWVYNLIKIKGDESAKNQCNRTIFFQPKNKKIKECQQMELF